MYENNKGESTSNVTFCPRGQDTPVIRKLSKLEYCNNIHEIFILCCIKEQMFVFLVTESIRIDIISKHTFTANHNQTIEN